MWFKKHIQLKNVSDEELVTRYREEQDQQYCAALYQRYVELIYGVCLKYFKDPEISKDQTLEVYQILQKKLLTHNVAQFRSWLYVLVKNQALQELRRKKKHYLISYDPTLMHSLDMEHPISDNGLEEKNQLLKDCVNNLPEKQKKVIDLFYTQGKSYDEIAILLTEKKDKIRSYIQNGRRNLKICMQQKNELQRKKI